MNANLLIYGAGEWNRTTDLRFTKTLVWGKQVPHQMAPYHRKHNAFNEIYNLVSHGVSWNGTL